MHRLDLLLVRHAEPVAPWTDGYAEDDRPLTDAGRRRAQELADEFDAIGLSAVYSSPYRRAVETVEPIARRHDLEVQLLPDLRERLLSPAPLPNWREHLERAWGEPGYALAGGESGVAAQRRAVAVLDLLRSRHADGGRVLAGSHGNLISLILQALEPQVDFAFHAAMPMPALYWLEHDGVTWHAEGGHGLDTIDARSTDA